MTWRPTAKLHAYLSLVTVGLIAGLAMGRPEPVVLVVPLALAIAIGLAAVDSPEVTTSPRSPSSCRRAATLRPWTFSPSCLPAWSRSHRIAVSRSSRASRVGSTYGCGQFGGAATRWANCRSGRSVRSGSSAPMGSAPDNTG